MVSAIFIDRDGTIIKEKNYISNPKQVELLSHSIEGIKLLRAAGFKLFVVTNQSGISRGWFSIDDLHSIHTRLLEMIKLEDTLVDKIYFCPHRQEDNCACRKPKPGMINQAQTEFNIDLSHSYIIGDRSEDIELGKALKLPNVLVLTGYGRRTLKISHPESDIPALQNLKTNTQKLTESDEILSEHGIKTLRPVNPDFVANNLLEAAQWICQQK